ncbi:MAG: DUF6498-containing protein [Arenimonas sp.]
MNRTEKPEASATMGLLISNALTLAMALILKWPLAQVLWPYWIQSLIIGWYARNRMLQLKKFSTEGFTSNDEPVPENEKGKRSTASFFVLHYGFFHLAYFLFLLDKAKLGSALDGFWIIVCGLSYTFAQRKTYQQQIASDALGVPNLGKLMCLPYLRILPMHLTIIFGMIGGSTFSILFFMTLKTIADILLDKLDRRPASTITNS